MQALLLGAESDHVSRPCRRFCLRQRRAMTSVRPLSRKQERAPSHRRLPQLVPSGSSRGSIAHARKSHEGGAFGLARARRRRWAPAWVRRSAAGRRPWRWSRSHSVQGGYQRAIAARVEHVVEARLVLRLGEARSRLGHLAGQVPAPQAQERGCPTNCVDTHERDRGGLTCRAGRIGMRPTEALPRGADCRRGWGSARARLGRARRIRSRRPRARRLTGSEPPRL